jgi:dihydrodipicolinate synthase/N-acetylneuraminate lyase
MTGTKKYSGVVVPMVSPFDRTYSVDIDAAIKISTCIVDGGAIPFLLGSTGEGPSMSTKQKSELVAVVANKFGRKTDIYAGITANSLSAAIEEAKLFASLGATVLVTTLPFYYPINDDQMERYFSELADKVPLPLLLYNMPGMVKRSIPLAVSEKLSYHPNIAGMKDSERDETRMYESLQLWSDRDDFSFFIGWAAMSAKGIAAGADGIVPSTGNFCPELYTKLMSAALEGNNEEAERLQLQTNLLSELYQKNRDLSQSIPALKSIMAAMGMCRPDVLPPLYRMDAETEKEFTNQVSTDIKRLYRK